MKKPDKLYELIQSMSMSEKRYFKLFATRHTIGEKNNYTTLFDVLEEMAAFDQAALLAILEKHGISIRHISSDKNYLYNLILRGLSAYHSGKTISLEIKEMLHQIEILYFRGLHDHCLPILRKAMKKSLKYDLYPLMLEIAHWQRKILRYEGDLPGVQASLNESMNHMALLDNLNAYMKLYFQVNQLRKGIDRARTLEERQLFDDYIAHPFLEHEEIALSHLARIYFWRCHALYNYTVNKAEAELRANERLLALMEEDPNYAQEYPSEYVTVHSRILDLKRASSDSEFADALAEFRAFPDRLKRSRRKVEAEVHSLSTLIELRRLLQNRKFGAAMRMYPETEAMLQRFRRLIPSERKAQFHYLHAYLHVGSGDYSSALKHLNPVLNDKLEQAGAEIRSFTRLLNLVVHYELQNERLLRYNIDATRRYLQKHNRLYAVEKCLIDLFRQLVKARNDIQTRQAMLDARTELCELLQNNFAKGTLAYFDILYWLDRKIDPS